MHRILNIMFMSSYWWQVDRQDASKPLLPHFEVCLPGGSDAAITCDCFLNTTENV